MPIARIFSLGLLIIMLKLLLPDLFSATQNALIAFFENARRTSPSTPAAAASLESDGYASVLMLPQAPTITLQ